MNPNTQGTLTILASSILFGSAGFWLMPGQAKGAITGAAAGAAVAAGHVQQDRRLRQLMAKQQKTNNAYQIKINSLAAATAQTKKNVEKVFLASKQYQAKLVELESNTARNPGSPNDNISNDVNRVETASRELGNKVNPTTELSLPSDYQDSFNVKGPATTEQEET